MQLLNHNFLNLLRVLTPRKLFNLSELYLSYQYSKLRGKSYHRGNPAVIEIEPTTSCNLGCPQCISGLRNFTRPTGKQDMRIFKKVIDELSPDLIWLVLFFQGEPFLHPQFLEMVSYAKQTNLFTATSSNGHFFSDEIAQETVKSGLNQLIISIDGLDQDSYQKYRIKGNLEKVIGGTKTLIKWKRQMKATTPHVIWQFVVFKHNEHQVPDVLKLASEIGVDEVSIKTAQVYNYESDTEFIPTNPEYSRYERQSDGTYRIRNSFLNYCWRMWKGSVITWDGSVVPCCFDKDAQHSMGSVQSHSYQELWKSSAYGQFRNSILTSRSTIDMCTNCSEGTKVFSKES